ncbi:MAG: sulfotransferase, partial [Phycisphaerales bacterium]|nr:sulfotransferase [Phycisphaerales bacterium]
RRQPGDAKLLHALCDLLLLQRRAEDARAILEPREAVLAPESRVQFARVLYRSGDLEKAEAVCRDVLDQMDTTPPVRVQASFALADTLDRLGRYDEAFEYYDQANALRPARHDPDAHARDVDTMIESWTPEAVASMTTATVAPQVILIVGMPRSGSSLVEQILASHPDVRAGGETSHLSRAAQIAMGPERTRANRGLVLRPGDIQSVEEASGFYLERSGATRSTITDKLPGNFLHLGFAQAVLPGAKVVHTVRDARDTCLSCYMQAFATGQGFTFDLGHLGRYHRDHDRLMAHWKATLDLPIHEVRYEALVGDQDGETRRLLEFLGLPWDDACLRFHETDRATVTASNHQVAQPMYDSSVGRWKAYEAHLGPLFEALSES